MPRRRRLRTQVESLDTVSTVECCFQWRMIQGMHRKKKDRGREIKST